MILARDQALSGTKATDLTVVHQVVDNKCSASYEKAITDPGINYERVPADNHQQNSAKRAIRRGKLTSLLFSVE